MSLIVNADQCIIDEKILTKLFAGRFLSVGTQTDADEFLQIYSTSSFWVRSGRYKVDSSNHVVQKEDTNSGTNSVVCFQSNCRFVVL